MHTVFVMLGGAALFVASLLLGHAFGAAAKGALWFIPFWAVVAIVNLWFGVSQAGYTIAEEAPIFVGVFGSLALLGAAAHWWLSRN